MESRAPYALIGLFMTAAIGAVFAFVFWLHNSAGLQTRTSYRIQFENTVAGLVDGAPVLFNGIRIGEVTGLQLVPDNPRRVMATIAVAAGAPLRPDTKVGLDFQGLSGVPVIALQGGAPDAPAWPPGTQAPLLVADPSVGISMGEAARNALLRLDAILSDNSEALKTAIANIKTFSDALARNSDRLDPIVAGIERMTGGGADQAPPESYDLLAPQFEPKPAGKQGNQFFIAEPTVLIAMDTQKILVRSDDHTSPGFGKAQWRDNVPKLVQEKLIQSFENAGYVGLASKPMEGGPPGRQLAIDLRRFEIVSADPAMADISFSARILSSEGKLLQARLFHATAPASASDVKPAIAGFDDAFGKVASELVAWAGEPLSRREAKPEHEDPQKLQ
jgi:phospholipid/cholesterol/gamma-HCH transport system substrate-binding protein